MANIPLVLNQPQVNTGLVTTTLTIPATGQYNVQFMATVPFAQAINSSASGNGIGAGYGGTVGAGSGMGLGSGAIQEGGGFGFTAGDQGTGKGNPGQSFGAGNNYPQPPAYSGNAEAASDIKSSLSVVVSNTTQVTTIYTSTAPAGRQRQVNFKVGFQANANDIITIALSSAASADNALQAIQSITSLNQGLL